MTTEEDPLGLNERGIESRDISLIQINARLEATKHLLLILLKISVAINVAFLVERFLL
jgi:hypothetical protein